MEPEVPLIFWVGFNLFVLLMLALDLGVFHRRAHVVSLKEALLWTGVWISLALFFNLGIFFWRGPHKALEFLTGYLIEYALSADNVFVFLLIFSYFAVPPLHQHRVLFWGILGAVVMRAIFIFTGVALIERFHGIIYVFGFFLIYTGVQMAREEKKEIHPEKNPLLRIFRRFMPVTEQYEGGRFFVKKMGKVLATPLFVVLLVVESTDVVFAVDSIPAILAITQDPFVVYTSNVFAVLGLRALFFVLSGMMRMFSYLHYGLSLILIFVGAKMLVSEFFEITIPIGIALGIIAAILAISVIASILYPKKEK